jgi:hypothetical protein
MYKVDRSHPYDATENCYLMPFNNFRKPLASNQMNLMDALFAEHVPLYFFLSVQTGDNKMEERPSTQILVYSQGCL